MSTPLFAPFAVSSSTLSRHGPTPSPFLAWNSSMVFSFHAIAVIYLRLVPPDRVGRLGGDVEMDLPRVTFRAKLPSKFAPQARRDFAERWDICREQSS